MKEQTIGTKKHKLKLFIYLLCGLLAINIARAVYPEPTNISRIYHVFLFVDEVTGNLFGLVVLAVFFIAFIVTKGYQYPNDRAFTVAAWGAMLTAFILRWIGTLNNLWVLLTIVATAVSSIYLYINQ